MNGEISNERKAYILKAKREKTAVLIGRIGLITVFFLIWELSTYFKLADPFIFSSPSRIAKTLVRLTVSGELWTHLSASVLETAAGFVLGTVFGTLIAILLWWSPRLSNILDPYLVVLNSLPKTALGPVFIVWMGAGMGSIIAMTLAISIIVTILDMHNGFEDTDGEKIKLLKTMGASKMQILTKLVLPSSFSAMINALKVNIGLSWVGVIMGEFLVSRAGLGYLIVYGSQVFKMDLVMTTVIVLAAASAIMYKGVLVLEKALKKYMGVTV